MGRTAPIMMGRTTRVLLEGVAAGLVGAVAVALVLGLWSLLSGRPFLFVPWALGSALLGTGLSGNVTPEPVGVYNAIHVSVSVVIGVVASMFVARAESRPGLTHILGLLAAVGVVYGVALLGAFAVEATEAVSWTAVLLANGAGAAAIGGYLFRAHPRLKLVPDTTPTEL